MRFKMVITYFLVILVILAALSVYVIETLQARLYHTESTEVFAKANIISGLLEADWDNYIYAEDSKYETPVNAALSGTDMRCIITNAAYVVLYDTSENSDMLGRAYTSEIVKAALDGGEEDEITTSANGGTTLAAAVPIMYDNTVVGCVLINKDVEYISDLARSIGRGTSIFGAVICLIIVGLTLYMSYAVTAPVKEFTAAAREISKGNFKQRVDIKGYSEMEQMAKAMNYMCDELELIEQKRRKFVSDASHELKTPMATIKLVCDSLVATPDASPETVREFMNDLSNEVDRLTRIIDKLLTLTRFDEGRNPLKLELVDLQMLMDRISAALTPIAAKKKINIYTDFGDEALPPIMLDYDKIWEAVYNIADNAIKYSPQGSYVRISVRQDAGEAVIRIEDNGPGIPEAERERIFDRFYRLDESRTRDTGGTGLGLAIAKEAVNIHGGTIEVRDTAAATTGSVFIIKLPTKS